MKSYACMFLIIGTLVGNDSGNSTADTAPTFCALQNQLEQGGNVSKEPPRGICVSNFQIEV